jgi:hypothetical protein
LEAAVHNPRTPYKMTNTIIKMQIHTTEIQPRDQNLSRALIYTRISNMRNFVMNTTLIRDHETSEETIKDRPDHLLMLRVAKHK